MVGAKGMAVKKIKYRIGDEFKATLIITDLETDGDCFELQVMELQQSLQDWVELEELEQAFNPFVRKKILLAKIEKHKKELARMEQELDQDKK
jgi:hypothetical protein